MVMCKNCLDTTIYEWRQIDGKWRLVNPNNGQVHQCKRDKPKEISASTPQFSPKDPPKTEQNWGEMMAVTDKQTGQVIGYQREGFYKCPHCPHYSGILNKKDPDFKEQLERHNSSLHQTKIRVF